MITRVEYVSADGRRVATIERIDELCWHVVRQWTTRTGRQMAIGPIAFTRLTSAQSNARTWVGDTPHRRLLVRKVG